MQGGRVGGLETWGDEARGIEKRCTKGKRCSEDRGAVMIRGERL